MRRLKTELAYKDAIIVGFEADRVQYQGTNAEILTLNDRLIFILLTFCLADAIIKAKELAESAGLLDQLRDKNIELKKLNESMSAELETAKKSLAKAEQILETKRQNHKDALREVQDRLDKRLDESLAIDNHLLSKLYLKPQIHCFLS